MTVIKICSFLKGTRKKKFNDSFQLHYIPSPDKFDKNDTDWKIGWKINRIIVKSIRRRFQWNTESQFVESISIKRTAFCKRDIYIYIYILSITDEDRFLGNYKLGRNCESTHISRKCQIYLSSIGSKSKTGIRLLIPRTGFCRLAKQNPDQLTKRWLYNHITK